jgi:UDP-N-acetylglucosamine transferase subunit ALG13
MIFVTVGTELPFDRLVRVVDDWARAHNRRDVFAQIGRTDWRPSFIPCAEFLEPPEFNARFASATAIVGHAGMGTILSALRYGKPILVMPRRASLGEQRNDHQLATAKRLLELDKIHVALDEQDLLDRLSNLERLHVRGSTGEFAGNSLLTALSDLIHHGAAVRGNPARLQPTGTPAVQPSPVGHLGLSR